MTRNFAYILFVFFIFSSCKNDDRLNIDYVTQFQESIKLLDKQNAIIYTDFKDLMIEHRARVEPLYNIMISVKNRRNELFTVLDSIVLNTTDIPIEKILKNFSDKNIGKTKTKLNKADIELIIENIDNYRTTLLGMIYDPKRNNGLIELINNTLSTKSFNSTNTFSENSVSITELLANIYKLKVDITIAEFSIISYLTIQIDCYWFNISKREVLIVPNSQIIPVGKPYKAQIFFIYCDTTAAPIFEIEGKRYETISGKGIYKHRVLEKSGKFEEIGNFLIKSPYTGEMQKIPFKIEYEVLEKK
jgi:hypothetical protein